MSTAGEIGPTGWSFSTRFRRFSMLQRAPRLVLKRRYASRQTFTGSISEMVELVRKRSARAFARRSRSESSFRSSSGTSSEGSMFRAITMPNEAPGNSFQNESSVTKRSTMFSFLMKSTHTCRPPSKPLRCRHVCVLACFTRGQSQYVDEREFSASDEWRQLRSAHRPTPSSQTRP